MRYFAYQIQLLQASGAVDALAQSRYDLLILEPTRTDWSSDQTKTFDTRAAVPRLKASKAHDGLHRKLVVAYVNIGEAEDWRWYWAWSREWPAGKPRPRDWPGYVLAPDPDHWVGDYPVAYWDPTWKDIVIDGQSHPPAGPRDFRSILDETLRDGFDGIYLDWVEAYSNGDVQKAAVKAGVEPATEMIKFIREMRDTVRKRNPDCVVIQQNASDLLDGHPELLQTIDAIAQEDVWYRGEASDEWDDPRGHDIPVDPDDTRALLNNLGQFRKAELPVFDVEYTVANASRAYAQSTENGFVPYCTRISLSRLTTTPPPGY